jgi:hypothetical protein
MLTSVPIKSHPARRATIVRREQMKPQSQRKSARRVNTAQVSALSKSVRQESTRIQRNKRPVSSVMQARSAMERLQRESELTVWLADIAHLAPSIRISILAQQVNTIRLPRELLRLLVLVAPKVTTASLRV